MPVVAFPHLGEDVPATFLLSTAYCFNKDLALRPGEVVGVHSSTLSLMLGSQAGASAALLHLGWSRYPLYHTFPHRLAQPSCSMFATIGYQILLCPNLAQSPVQLALRALLCEEPYQMLGF